MKFYFEKNLMKNLFDHFNVLKIMIQSI